MDIEFCMTIIILTLKYLNVSCGDRRSFEESSLFKSDESNIPRCFNSDFILVLDISCLIKAR